MSSKRAAVVAIVLVALVAVALYPARNLLFAILNRVSIRKQVEQESDRAVRNLKRAVESMA